MREFITRQVILWAILIATLVLYFHATVPAIARNRQLAEQERARLARIETMRDEALRLKVRIKAIQTGDAAVMEREIRDRFLPGARGIERAGPSATTGSGPR